MEAAVVVVVVVVAVVAVAAVAAVAAVVVVVVAVAAAAAAVAAVVQVILLVVCGWWLLLLVLVGWFVGSGLCSYLCCICVCVPLLHLCVFCVWCGFSVEMLFTCACGAGFNVIAEAKKHSCVHTGTTGTSSSNTTPKRKRRSKSGTPVTRGIKQKTAQLGRQRQHGFQKKLEL